MMKEKNKYDMTFEDACDFESKIGLDIPWNDGDIYIDSKNMTQSVANVAKWAMDRQTDIIWDSLFKWFNSDLPFDKEWFYKTVNSKLS